MTHRYFSFSTAGAIAAAALCLVWHATAKAQNIVSPNYDVRPACNCGASCLIRPGTYGYNDTTWRQWPTQYRPEVSDPRTVGTRRIPAPPGAPEQKLPEAPNMLGPPSGGSILPGGLAPPGSGGTILPGGVAPPGSGASILPRQPGGPASGIPPTLAPGPEGTLIFPGDLGTPQKLPDLKSGGEGGGLLPPSEKAPAPSDANKSGAAPSPPATTPSQDKSTSGPPSIGPPKADAPSAPGDITPGKPTPPSAAWQRARDTVAAGNARPESPHAMLVDPLRGRADAELNDNADASPQRGQLLRPASFQQNEPQPPIVRSTRLPSPLEGYCPVELRENEQWVAGRAEYQTTYKGQVYRFSSAAAQKRFVAAPQDYAPVHGGNDIVAATAGNASLPGSIQHSAVWQGRLYLFASAANLTAFHKDPARYLNRQPAAPKPLPHNLQLPVDSL